LRKTPDGGYTALAVGENIFTQGEDVEDLKTMIREAIECHFDEPAQRPTRVNLNFCEK